MANSPETARVWQKKLMAFLFLRPFEVDNLSRYQEGSSETRSFNIKCAKIFNNAKKAMFRGSDQVHAQR